MKYGDVVKHKDTGQYGTVHYSFFGASIHVYDEENNALGKYLGDSWENVQESWKVCRMPKGYEWDESRLYIKKKE